MQYGPVGSAAHVPRESHSICSRGEGAGSPTLSMGTRDLVMTAYAGYCAQFARNL